MDQFNLLSYIEGLNMKLNDIKERIVSLENRRKTSLSGVTNQTEINQINKTFDSELRSLNMNMESLIHEIEFYKRRVFYFTLILSEEERIQTERAEVKKEMERSVKRLKETENIRKDLRKRIDNIRKRSNTIEEFNKNTFVEHRHLKDLSSIIRREFRIQRWLRKWEEDLNERERIMKEAPPEEEFFEEGGGEFDIPEDEDEDEDVIRRKCKECDQFLDFCKACKQFYCEDCDGAEECKRCENLACPFCEGAYGDKLCDECRKARKKRKRKKKKRKPRGYMTQREAIIAVLSDANDWMTAVEIWYEIDKRRISPKSYEKKKGKSIASIMNVDIKKNGVKSIFQKHPTAKGLFKLRTRDFDADIEMTVPKEWADNIIDLSNDPNEPTPTLPMMTPERVEYEDPDTITGEKREREEDEDDEERERKKRKLEALIRARIREERKKILAKVQSKLQKISLNYKLVKK